MAQEFARRNVFIVGRSSLTLMGNSSVSVDPISLINIVFDETRSPICVGSVPPI